MLNTKTEFYELWQKKDGAEDGLGGHVLDFYYEFKSCDDPPDQFFVNFLKTISYIMI